MLRLTEVKLALDHQPQALAAQVAQILGVQTQDLVSLKIFKRSFDARKAQLLQVYIVDVALVSADLEEQVLGRHAANPQLRRAPDMAYHLPLQAKSVPEPRPVVVVNSPPARLSVWLKEAVNGKRLTGKSAS